MSASLIAKLEQGTTKDPTLSTLQALAGAYNVSVVALLAGLPTTPLEPGSRRKGKKKDT